MKLTDKITVTNEDCMDLMARYPDGWFNISICDPPYRDEIDNQPTKDMRKNGMIENFGNKPGTEYFDKLFRISKKSNHLGRE